MQSPKRSSPGRNKTRKRSRSRSRSSGKVYIKGVDGTEMFTYETPITVAQIRSDIYPGKDSHRIPRIVVVGSNNEGFASGMLEPGRYTLVKLFRKKLPKPKIADGP